MPRLRLTPLGPLDLRLTLGPLRHGRYDPTIRLTATELWRASRSPHGPVTLHLRWDGRAVEAAAWGPGAEWELAHLPELVGETDRPRDLVPRHDVVTELVRRLPGLRMCRTNRVVEALVPGVLEQKVVGLEAHRVWSALVRRYGAAAPTADAAGPPVRLPPDPATLGGLPYYAFHPLGLERRRAEVLGRVGRSALALEAVVPLRLDQAEARLRLLPGIGPWTAAEALRVACGDPTRSASATTTCRASWPGCWRASRPPMTRACSSCSSPTAASARGWWPCSSMRPPAAATGTALAPREIAG